MIECPTCGTTNPASSNFCSNCGTRLQPTTSTVEADPEQPPRDEPEPLPSAAADTPSPSADVVDPGTRSAETGPPAGVPSPHVETPERPPSDAAASSRPGIPPPVTLPPRNASQLPGSAPEWRMSDAGPLPEPRGRRRWLWVALGIVGFCALVCVGVLVWSSTDTGQRVMGEIQTAGAEAQQTQEAGE